MRKLLLILTFVAAPSLLFAAAGDMYTVHAWGYGDLLYNVLRAITTLVGSGSYHRMLSIALLIGALVAVLSLMNAKDFSVYMVAQKVIAGILMYTFIVFSPHDILITDHTTSKNYEVRNVPVMVGFPLMLFSNLERGASEIFRTSLASSPGGLAAIGAVPVVTGYDLLYTSSNYRIQDPNFNRTMSEFVQNCVYPDILSGYLDVGSLVDSNTFWNLLNNTHPARVSGVFGAGSSTLDGNIRPCSEVYTTINSTLDKYVGSNGKAKKQLAASMGFLADDQIDTLLGTVSKQTFNYQQSGQDFLRNAIALNNFNDAYATTAQQVGMDTSGIAYGVAKGSETAAAQMTLSGIMAKKYMPISKGFMTVIMIAIIPLIMLIGLATNSVRKPVGMIVGILTALSLWAIGSQLLDFFIMIRTKSLMSGIENGVYSMATKPIVEQGILDSINMAMSMYWMIPTLSFAVASMSGYSASQMMSGVGATANSAIGGAAGEVASGSASYGVTRTNMMSANKYDGVSSLRGGTASQSSLISNSVASNDRAASSDTSLSQVDSLQKRKDINEQDSIKKGSVEEDHHIVSFKNNNTHEEVDSIKQQYLRLSEKRESRINLSEDIDKSIKDSRDQILSGVDILGGNKSVMDNSSKNISGNSSIEDNTNTFLTGDIANIYKDAVNVQGGTDFKGFNTAGQVVKEGLSQYSGNEQALESVEKNFADHLSAFAQRSGTTQYSEKQVGSIAAKLQGGFNLFGKGIETSMGGSYDIARNSLEGTTVDYNMVFTKAAVDRLESDKAAGKYDDANGNFISEKYDEDARSYFGAIEGAVKDELGVDRGPGSVVQNIGSEAMKKLNEIGENRVKEVQAMPDEEKKRLND